MTEPILTENPNRYVLFPIQYLDIYQMYKKLITVRWIVEEVDLSKDVKDFEALSNNEKHFLKRILGFFAGSDGIVNDNLVANFSNEVQIPEAKAFYAEQMSNETVHSEQYALLIDTYIQDREEKLEILRSITTQAYTAKKAEWALSWIKNKEEPFATRLVAFAVIEGIFFSGAFCSIFYFKQRGVLPGLTLSNEFISRDEGLHTEFACLLYSKLEKKLSKKKVYALFEEAVKIEKEFIIDALPCSLLGINSASMSEYIEFVADRLLIQLGYNPLYNTSNPFAWMQNISLEGKDNFFEKKVSNYALAKCNKKPEDMMFKMDSDF